MYPNLIFKKVNGEVVDNIESYVKNWVANNPYGNVIIGCDSQVHGRRVKYSIAIVMHYIDRMGVGHGGHVIVADVWEKRNASNAIDEMPVKLWREAEFTVMAAQMIEGTDNAFKKRMLLHLDFNNDTKHKSNMMFAAGLGYLQGMGYKAEGKPFSYVATHTADHFAR